MKVVVAIDSFKGCLTSKEANQAAAEGIRDVFPDAEIVQVPVSDGGEGFMEAFYSAIGGSLIEVSVRDPLMRSILAKYLLKDEIPARLIREEYSSRTSSGFYGKRSDHRTRYEEWSENGDHVYGEPEIRTKTDLSSLGKPKLKIKGHDLESIPGVSRGFIGSAANVLAGSAMQNLFSPGDRVRHPKFGLGTVSEVKGSGKETRIHVMFDTCGEKELALAMAPIVKVEEKE